MKTSVSRVYRRGVWVLILLMLCSPMAVQAADHEYGPPWVLDLEYEHPAGLTVVGDTVYLLDSRTHRLLATELTEDFDEPTWSVILDTGTLLDGRSLSFPEAIAQSAEGHLYIADSGNNRVVLLRREADGSYVHDPDFVRDGPPDDDPRPLLAPRALAVAADGSVYLLDSGNGRVLTATGPVARRWSTYQSDPEWLGAGGLALAPEEVVWLADTANHRLVRLEDDEDNHSLGRYGETDGLLRHPRDMAFGPRTGRIYVSDTHNHRILILNPDGSVLRSLGGIPLLSSPNRITVDEQERVWVTDAANRWLVMWPGPFHTRTLAESRPSDVYLRSSAEDDGSEPLTPDHLTYEIPDLLISSTGQLDLDVAIERGLDTMGNELSVYGRDSYLYFHVHNRGREPFAGGVVGAWSVKFAAGLSFPQDWDRSSFRRVGEVPPTDGRQNFIDIGFVPAGGSVVVGPLIWRPQEPDDAADCQDMHWLMLRIVHVDEPIEPGDWASQALTSNNVVVHRTSVAKEHCAVAGDRYERNDHVETAAWVNEDWQHLGARCPRPVARALGIPYPQADCPGVFEDGPTVKSAEEIWSLTVPDLSLHSTHDRDFFIVPLPDMSHPRWGLEDIHPQILRERLARNPDYQPMPMPDCGAVQRQEFGPANRDNTVWVSISSELLISVEATNSETSRLTERSLDTTGESVRLYVNGSAAPDLGSGGALMKRVICPQSHHQLDRLMMSFGERQDPEGVMEPRSIYALGGYQIRLDYLTSIERGIPDWAREHNDGRSIGRIPCLSRPGLGRFSAGLGSLPGNWAGNLQPAASFPACGLGRGPGPWVIFPQHPQLSDLTPCLADGPGCRELSRFRWTENLRDLSVLIAAPRTLKIRLIDESGQVLSVAQAVSSPILDPQRFPGAAEQLADWAWWSLDTATLQAGLYFMEVEGEPTGYLMHYTADYDDPEADAEPKRRGWVKYLLAALLFAIAGVLIP